MRRMRKSCLALLLCLLTLSGCTSVPGSLYEISKSKDSDKISVAEKEEKTDLQSCTVNPVTFSVSKELKPMEQEGAFTTKSRLKSFLFFLFAHLDYLPSERRKPIVTCDNLIGKIIELL